MSLETFWYWWIAGLLLMVLEAFAPGAFFLWIGISALAVGTVVWVGVAISSFAQVLLFAVLSLGSVYAVRHLRGKRDQTSPVEARLNERARLYEGRIFTLDAAIVNGVGNLRVDDGQWRIIGPDLLPGARVRVLSAEGATLKVEKCD